MAATKMIKSFMLVHPLFSCSRFVGAPGGSVSGTADVSVTHSGHSLRYIGGRSSNTTFDNRLRGHFEHERQKCQMSSPGGERYSMNAPRPVRHKLYARPPTDYK